MSKSVPLAWITRLGPRLGFIFAIQIWVAQAASAHTSEGGFVLLLPTDVYVFSGGLSVGLTALTLVMLPPGFFAAVFKPRLWNRLSETRSLRQISSLVSCGVLFWLLYIGGYGPRDPLANLLPLTLWTVWWIGLVVVQGVFGDVWRWLNPWTGPVAVIRKILQLNTYIRFPIWLGQALTLVTFVGFVAVILVDPAPSDPERLARYVSAYWAVTLIGAVVFGPRWMMRAEGISAAMRCYGAIGIVGKQRDRQAIGITGWQILNRRRMSVGTAILVLLILGTGSFDGLNETFWWLGLIGINPLEFPGRSAVMLQNLVGLVAANAALILAFGLTVSLGLKLSRSTMQFGRAFCLFAPTILPIALGYHFAHYFTSFLVQIQYFVAAATDPWASGADLLGLGDFYVTTGFFNTHDSVRILWLTQAGAIVLGHMLAILLAHAVAVRNFATNRAAVLSQIPLSIFMIGYTFFGLWLLASPRGF